MSRRLRSTLALVIGAAFLVAFGLGQSPPAWSLLPTAGQNPPVRYSYASTVHESDVYVHGGVSGTLRTYSELSDLWRYSLGGDVWERVAVIGTKPSQRYGHCLASSGGFIWLFGGADTNSYMNEVWRMDLALRVWELIPQSVGAAVPRGRSSSGCLRRNSDWYIFGGDSLYGGLSDAWSFNFNTLQWTDRNATNLASAFLGGGQFTVNHRPLTDTAVVFGGYPANRNIADELNVVSEYNYATATWTRMAVTGTVPAARYAHVAMIINETLYVTLGFTDSDQIDLPGMSALDLSTGVWRTVTATGDVPSPRDSTALLQPIATDAAYGYLFGGWGSTVTNDLTIFNAHSESWMRVRSLLTAPGARSGHTMEVNGLNAYVFGGTDGTVLLNDVWTVNTQTGLWTQQIPIGTISERKGHAAAFVGDQMFVFGGNGGAAGAGTGTALLNDMHVLDCSKQIPAWSAVTYSSTATLAVPEARFGHALAANHLFLYLFGGKGSINHLNDVYRFDTVARFWSVVSPFVASTVASTSIPIGRESFAFAVLSPQTGSNGNGTFEFAVYGGLTQQYGALYDVWTFKVMEISAASAISTASQPSGGPAGSTPIDAQTLAGGGVINSNVTWTLVATYSDIFPRSESASFTNGNKLVVHGGTSSGDLLSETFRVSFDSTASHAVRTDFTPYQPPTPLQSPGYLAAHRAVSTLGSALVFGGFTSLPETVSTSSTGFPILTSNTLFKLTLNLCSAVDSFGNQIESNSCFRCNPGSYYSGGACVACAAGTYQSLFGQSSCVGCAAGFFSHKTGSQSSLGCRACPAGFYSATPGSTDCAPCGPLSTCAVASSAIGAGGSATPAAGSAGTAPVILTQPTTLQSNAVYVSETQLNMVISLIVIFISMLIVYSFFPKNVKQKFVMVLDLYSRQHRALTQEQRWSKEWKTSLGGLVSALLVVTAAFFIVIQSLPWLDNQIETRALVPAIVLDRSVTANIDANVTFDGYGDRCSTAPNGVAGSCSSAVDILFSDPVFDSNGRATNGDELRCVSTARTCQVLWHCDDCAIGAKSIVTFVLSQPLSFASAIYWTLATDSAVPDQSSSASSSLTPAVRNEVFRGLSPTTVRLLLTPTVYTKSSNNATTSGYLLEFSSNSTGTTADANSFQYVRSVLFSFELSRADTALKIDLDVKFSTTAFLAALLGSISGLFSLFGFLLSLFEKIKLKEVRDKCDTYEKLVKVEMPNHLPWAMPDDDTTTTNHDWIMHDVLERAKIKAPPEKMLDVREQRHHTHTRGGSQAGGDVALSSVATTGSAAAAIDAKEREREAKEREMRLKEADAIAAEKEANQTVVTNQPADTV